MKANEESRHRTSLGAIVQEADEMLRGLAFDVARGAYLQGERVTLALDPRLAATPGRFDLLVTVFPLEATPRDLEGLEVWFRVEPRRLGTAQETHRMDVAVRRALCVTLNVRGQAVLHDVEEGTYRGAGLAGAREEVAEVLPFPYTEPVDLAPAVGFGGTEAPVLELRRDDGRMALILRRAKRGQSPMLELTVIARGREHHRLLAEIALTPAGTTPERFFVPMSWQDWRQECVGTMDYTGQPQDVGVSIAAEARDPRSLAEEDLSDLVSSIVCASADTRDAWAEVVQNLASEVYSILQLEIVNRGETPPW